MSMARRYAAGIVIGVVASVVCERALAPYAPALVVEFIATTIGLFCVLWAAQPPRPRSDANLPVRIGVTLGASLAAALAGLVIRPLLDWIWP